MREPGFLSLREEGQGDEGRRCLPTTYVFSSSVSVALSLRYARSSS